MVFGFAESEAVGAVGAGGGGGGGGAGFFAHAPRNISAPTATARLHILIWCFTSSSKCLCARIVACNFAESRRSAHLAGRDAVTSQKTNLLPEVKLCQTKTCEQRPRSRGR